MISNFYYNETAYASYVQQIAGRLALDLSGRYVLPQLPGLCRRPDDDQRARRQLLPGRARRSTTSCATGSTSASATRCSPTTARHTQSGRRRRRLPEAAGVCPARASRTRLRRHDQPVPCRSQALACCSLVVALLAGCAARHRARRSRSARSGAPAGSDRHRRHLRRARLRRDRADRTFRVATDGTIDYPLAGRLQVAACAPARSSSCWSTSSRTATSRIRRSSSPSRIGTARRSRSSARSPGPGRSATTRT